MKPESTTLSGQTLVPTTRTGKYRYVVLAMVTLGIAINYLDRATISVALPDMQADLGFSEAVAGMVLAAFFWTYAGGQLPAGFLAGKLGPRKLVTLSALVFGLVTMLTGLAWGIVSLVVLRLLLGLGESPAYPAAAQVVSEWFPRRERSFASGTFNNGNPIGSTLCIPLVALLVTSLGWRPAFFVAGGIAVVYAAAWWLFYRSPRESQRLSPGELAHIESDQETRANAGDEPVAVPWGSLFRHRTVWAMMIGFFCVNFVAYFFITWFPTYLVNTYNLTLLKFGFIGMIPGIASMLGGWTGGLVSDWLVRRGTDLTKARKICLVGGLLGTSVIALAVVSPSVTTALVALSVSYFSSTFAAASVWCLPADVAPTAAHVGSLGGIQNAASNCAGIVSPVLIGVITGMTSSFAVPMLIAGCVAIIGALNYAFFLPRLRPLEP
ncbi:MFS transporter [Prauserella rugosa]|uniref:ACS family glucarate transporter-like MFS transporter n=1 Tax=Prauserella rugosa TaxID=43354 RepID=A0A660CL94_9PSEU|nr:MFS transporter [Prauserella rugosa]KMS72019.1 MFS transporter [Streptomyces regensis]TWH21815.1 ACS family glucarate transporter-like MFS transporter [Prauserella rugosa]